MTLVTNSRIAVSHCALRFGEINLTC